MQNTEQIVPSTKQWTESKEVRKARKRKEKAQAGMSVQPPMSDKNYVFCLKWGEKYSSEYVNKLHSMVQRNLTIEHEFVCYTENSKGIASNITTCALPKKNLSGWWFKPWFLSNDLGVSGTGLFLDLDLIVFRNIDKLFTYEQDSNFTIIRDFNRIHRRSWEKMNSSVFKFKIGKFDPIYREFDQNSFNQSKRYPGDQDWMYANIKKFTFWPDEWIQSYKWEMRGRKYLGIVDGKRNFVQPGEPVVPKETSIAVFHGQPNMHDCNDEWPRRHWY